MFFLFHDPNQLDLAFSFEPSSFTAHFVPLCWRAARCIDTGDQGRWTEGGSIGWMGKGGGSNVGKVGKAYGTWSAQSGSSGRNGRRYKGHAWFHRTRKCLCDQEVIKPITPHSTGLGYQTSLWKVPLTFPREASLQGRRPPPPSTACVTCICKPPHRRPTRTAPHPLPMPANSTSSRRHRFPHRPPGGDGLRRKLR